MKFVKNFKKFQEELLFIATSILRQKLQKVAVTKSSEKFECPSEESLPKFKEHLFLMTAFKVCHMCREHEEDSSKYGGVEGALGNVWKSMGRGNP